MHYRSKSGISREKRKKKFVKSSIICNFKDKFVFLQTRLCCCCGCVGWGTSAAHPGYVSVPAALPAFCIVSSAVWRSLLGIKECLLGITLSHKVLVWVCCGKCIFNVNVPSKSIQLVWLPYLSLKAQALKTPMQAASTEILSTVVEQELLQQWLIDFTDTLFMLTDVTEESCLEQSIPWARERTGKCIHSKQNLLRLPTPGSIFLCLHPFV